MSDKNQAFALPSGSLISQNGLSQLKAQAGNTGGGAGGMEYELVHSGEKFSMSDLSKVYLI